MQTIQPKLGHISKSTHTIKPELDQIPTLHYKIKGTRDEDDDKILPPKTPNPVQYTKPRINDGTYKKTIPSPPNPNKIGYSHSMVMIPKVIGEENQRVKTGFDGIKIALVRIGVP